MEINLMIILALIIIALVSVVSLVSFRNKAKASGTKLSAIESIMMITDIALPALRVGFDIAMAERKADDGGFEAVKHATMAHVMNALEEAGYSQLNSDELDRILNYCDPLLEQLWKYKIEVPNKNISRKALTEIRAEIAEK